MNERVRYAYTYFLHPFKVNNKEKYLTSLLANKNISIKLFEKEKDLDIYSYFSSDAKLEFFESFQLKREEQTKIMNKQSIKGLLKQKTVYLEYNNQQAIPAKLGEKDGIFFSIEKLEIICFSTGTCFLVMKTQLEDIHELSQILDFNYEFRKISSGKKQEKNNQSIKIQNNSFESAEGIIELINSLTMQNSEEKEMLVYSYVCISSEDWNKKEDFQTIQEGYQKLIHVKHSQDKEKIVYGKSIYETNYMQVGISRNGMGVAASSKNDFNYTKLPYYLERQYLYTFIIGIYQKEKMIQRNINGEIQTKITEDELGIKLLQEINKQIQLSQKYKNAKISDEKHEQKKNKQLNQILLIILGISLIFNLINLWILFNMLNR